MAAAEVRQTPSLDGSSAGGGSGHRGSRSNIYGHVGRHSISKNSRSILLDTMEMVEPKKSLPVPNHLLESKIYSKVAQNSVVQARPAVLHFGGFEVGRLHTATLQLANVSTEVQRMHVIPPQTHYFYVKYTKNDRLVPGLTLDCTIEFTPDEWRYYYDCIRIHTPGEENLVIPIHAYPVMNTSEFPESVTFPPVPVGSSKDHRIPLRSHAPIDFEFQMTVLQPHPAFTVNPMAGLVPANGEVEVTVTFSPTEFSTASMSLQLTISEFNAKPLVCTFSGSSAPGLAKQLLEESESSRRGLEVLDPRCLSPLDRSRAKRKKSKKSPLNNNTVNMASQEIEFAGIKFPANLDTPYAVAQVLNQQPGKLRIKDLREAVLSKKGKSGVQTRQMKEAVFEVAVRKDVYEERQNQLRWQVKLGDDHISPSARQAVLDDREAAWDIYKRERGDPVEEEEARRTCTNCTFRRTRRDTQQVAEEKAQFDMYTNNAWAARHATLTRFQQAARKVIVRLRADKKLKSLRQMVIDWGQKKYSNSTTAAEKEKQEDEDVMHANLETTELQVDRVKSITFPTYVAPEVKDDMAVDALGTVPYKPTEVVVWKKVPYFNLKVSQHYRLMGYQPHNVHEASSSYVSPKLSRPLRSGAEDEIISLPAPKLQESYAKTEDMVVNEGDMKVEDVVDQSVSPVITVEQPQAEILKPPQALFQPVNYPPLHIFNPAPGLQVFQPPLPYDETDPDFHLCPLPRYTRNDPANPHASTQRQYLDREDVIRGVMGWKRFPSQGLTSLSNTPTLTNVWVPRWGDAFGSELLPNQVPPLYSGLSDADREQITEIPEDDVDEGAEDEAVELTPDMVNAQFPLIDVNEAVSEDKHKKEEMFPHGNKMPSTNIPVGPAGPVPREKREQELDYFLRRKYNRLGRKIQAKTDNLNNLKTNQDLVLK